MGRSIINIGSGNTTILSRSSAFKSFIETVRRYEMLSQEEETNLLREYFSSKDNKRKKEIRDILLQSNQRFIIAAAKQYASGNIELFLDLIGEANVGFIEAIDKYDFNKGKKLISWAAWYIRRNCNLYVINYNSMVKQSNASVTYHKLSNTRDILTQQLGREPTDEEIIEYLNAQGVAIKDTRDVRKLTIASIDIDVAEEDSYNHTCTDFDNATANENNCEKDIDQNYTSLLIKSALHVLSDRDRSIIQMLYGLNDQAIEYSIESIAAIFGCTNERVRQIHVAALKKMASKVKLVSKRI